MDHESDHDDTDFVERDYYSISKLSFRVLRNLTRKSWLSTEDVRESAWDNIVTCHQGVIAARTWSFQRKSIGKHQLKSQADDRPGPVVV